MLDILFSNWQPKTNERTFHFVCKKRLHYSNFAGTTQKSPNEKLWKFKWKARKLKWTCQIQYVNSYSVQNSMRTCRHLIKLDAFFRYPIFIEWIYQNVHVLYMNIERPTAPITNLNSVIAWKSNSDSNVTNNELIRRKKNIVWINLNVWSN